MVQQAVEGREAVDLKNFPQHGFHSQYQMATTSCRLTAQLHFHTQLPQASTDPQGKVSSITPNPHLPSPPPRSASDPVLQSQALGLLFFLFFWTESHYVTLTG